jgi:hypothetical protein
MWTYEDKNLADKCEGYCRKHNARSLEITPNAIKTK